MILFVVGEALNALRLLYSPRGIGLNHYLLFAVVAATALLCFPAGRTRHAFSIVVLQSLLMALAHRNRIEILVWIGAGAYLLVKELRERTRMMDNVATGPGPAPEGHG
jgi:hypothetical protein